MKVEDMNDMHEDVLVKDYRQGVGITTMYCLGRELKWREMYVRTSIMHTLYIQHIKGLPDTSLWRTYIRAGTNSNYGTTTYSFAAKKYNFMNVR